MALSIINMFVFMSLIYINSFAHSLFGLMPTVIIYFTFLASANLGINDVVHF